MRRRDILKKGGLLAACGACAYGLPLLSAARAGTKDCSAGKGRKWGMVVDLSKCPSGIIVTMSDTRLPATTCESAQGPRY